jgi:hypothetical protein
MLRATKPSDLVEEEWKAKAVARLYEYQKVDPELRDLLTKIEVKTDAPLPKQKTQEALEKQRNFRIHRSAVNLYFLEQPPPPRVDPERLAQFLAAMPPWIRATFDAYPADEARRRLTLAYRLVYPHPNEFKPSTSTNTASVPASKPSAVPTPPQPVLRPDRTAPKRPASGTPF